MQALQRITPQAEELDTLKLGELLAKSGYFQDARDMAQCVVKVLAGRELGLGAVASMTGIYIVKNRVTLSANLMAALVKRSGRYNYRVVRMDDKGCEIEFFEGGQPIGRSKFDHEDAQRAGLASGDNWKKFARNMYFARAMSNGVKWYCPDVFAGPVYTPDELGAEVDEEGGAVEAHAPRPVPHADAVAEAEPAEPEAEEAQAVDAEVEQQPEAQPDRPASKADILRDKRAQGIASMGLVTREGDIYRVTTPSLRGRRAAYEVSRNQAGKVICTCAEFQEQSAQDVSFRCEHILAVKHSLLQKAAEAPAEKPAKEAPPTISEVRDNPHFDGVGDMVTPTQLGLIRKYALEAQVDAEEECARVLKCKTEELSKRAALALIEHLKDGAPDTPK